MIVTELNRTYQTRHMKPLISDAYRQQQMELHQNPDYGRASLMFAPKVARVIKQHNIASVSDYGAGKCNLLVGLDQAGIPDIEYYPYDPAFPEYGAPQPADLLVCLDVLEHIEPELLDNVLADLHSVCANLGFFSIHTGPAIKILSDGRNAHLIQEPNSWWLPQLSRYFEVQHLETLSNQSGFWVLVKRKQPKANQ